MAPVVDVLDVSVGLGLGQVDDGARDDTAKTMTSVATLGASSSSVGDRLDSRCLQRAPIEDECDVPVVLGLGEDDHGMLRDEGNNLLSSETSPVPWRDDDRRQEQL